MHRLFQLQIAVAAFIGGLWLFYAGGLALLIGSTWWMVKGHRATSPRRKRRR